jgi:hypothetical protein
MLLVERSHGESFIKAGMAIAVFSGIQRSEPPEERNE